MLVFALFSNIFLFYLFTFFIVYSCFHMVLFWCFCIYLYNSLFVNLLICSPLVCSFVFLSFSPFGLWCQMFVVVGAGETSAACDVDEGDRGQEESWGVLYSCFYHFIILFSSFLLISPSVCLSIHPFGHNTRVVISSLMFPQEKERLKQEKRDEKRLNKQRRLELRRLELEMVKELNKPTEDMCLSDHKVNYTESF